MRQAERNGGSRNLFYHKVEEILGSDLKKIFWGTKENHKRALRHRLSHGEYFDLNDIERTDYVGEVHRSVVRYFNERIFKKKLLDETIVSRQRHPLGITYQGGSFIKATGDAKLCLIDVLADTDKHGSTYYKSYEILPPTDYDGSY